MHLHHSLLSLWRLRSGKRSKRRSGCPRAERAGFKVWKTCHTFLVRELRTRLERNSACPGVPSATRRSGSCPKLGQNQDETVKEKLPERGRLQASDEAGLKSGRSEEAAGEWRESVHAREGCGKFAARLTSAHGLRRGELAVEDSPQPSAKASDEAGAMLDGRGKTCPQPMTDPRLPMRLARTDLVDIPENLPECQKNQDGTVPETLPERSDSKVGKNCHTFPCRRAWILLWKICHNRPMQGPRMRRARCSVLLSEKGMSTRAIGSALGIGDATVRRDMKSTASSDAVEPRTVRGVNGKSYDQERLEPSAA